MTEQGSEARGSTREAVSERRCAWCRRVLGPAAPTGRPRTYCRQSCRQRAFEARRRLSELSWGESRVQRLVERQDDVQLAIDGLVDLLDDLRADLDDTGFSADRDHAVQLLGRLDALVGDLRGGTPAGSPDRT